jgi:hypothetical protein
VEIMLRHRIMVLVWAFALVIGDCLVLLESTTSEDITQEIELFSKHSSSFALHGNASDWECFGDGTFTLCFARSVRHISEEDRQVQRELQKLQQVVDAATLGNVQALHITFETHPSQAWQDNADQDSHGNVLVQGVLRRLPAQTRLRQSHPGDTIATIIQQHLLSSAASTPVPQSNWTFSDRRQYERQTHALSELASTGLTATILGDTDLTS